MPKGITPVIAIVLLLMVTVAIAGAAFIFLQSTFRGASETTGEQLQYQMSMLSNNFRIDNADNYLVNIRNMDAAKELAGIKFYLNGAGTAVYGPAAVAAGGIGTFFLQPESVEIGDEVELKITSFATTSKAGHIFSNVAPNPGFEWSDASPPAGWGQETGTSSIVSDAHSGSRALYFPGDGAYHRISSSYAIRLAPGQRVFGKLWYKSVGGNALYFGINYYGCTSSEPYWAYFGVSYSNTNGQWTELSGTITVPEGKTCGRIWLFNYAGNTGPVWVDDVFVGSE